MITVNNLIFGRRNVDEIDPIFNQPAALFSGSPGETYTYSGTVSDPGNTNNILNMSVVSGLPSGWSFIQIGNSFTLTGVVPAGADYSIILQVADLSSVPNITQQLVSVNAVFATLSTMEFKLNYIVNNPPINATGSSPKTTSPIVLSRQPTNFDNGHGCNRAQFNLVVGVYANTNGGTWEWLDLGKGSLNNVTGVGPYNVFDANIKDLALMSYIDNGTTIPESYLNILGGGQVDLHNIPVTTFSSGNTQSYYVASTATIGSSDRASYFDILSSEATLLANKSNWIGSPNKGIVKFKLVPNSYDRVETSVGSGIFVGQANYHSNSSWLQVFKQNSAGTNQEEVLINNESFLLSASVVITVNILNNSVSVGTT